MNIRCGIDLGTTYSAISYYDEDNHRVETIDLEHADGQRIIPSVVFFEPGGNVIVGEPARNAALSHSDRVIIGIKRSMGDSYKTAPIDGRQYTPQEVSAEILKTLKEDAEVHLNRLVSEVVITVPAHFGDLERNATKEAAELAGLKVLELIPEPHAAALAYAIETAYDIGSRNLIVYDLGGGTFDVTLIRTWRENEGDTTNLQIDTLSKDGNRHLGGLDWDRIMARIIADKAMDEYNIDDPHFDPKSEATLLSNAEKAKRMLSTVSSTSVVADLQGHQVDVTRTEFESQSNGLLLGAERLVMNVLEDAEQNYGLLSEKRIQELVAEGQDRAELEAKKVQLLLSGGSTRMPMVKECVERLMGEPPLHHRNPELLVTIGAAYRAFLAGSTGIVETPRGGIRMKDDIGQIGKPIGVEVVFTDDQGNVTGKQNVVIIKDKAPYGQDYEQVFQTAFDDMTEIPLIFYEGDSPKIEECIRLADVSITGIPPKRPAGSEVKVSLQYDKNGIISGQAIDVESGKDVEIKIERPR
jgi:molecular chaperone DnaK